MTMEGPLIKKQRTETDVRNGSISSINGETASVFHYNDLYSTKYTIQDTKSPVNSVKICPNGTKFATASSDSIIRIYNLSDGSLVGELHGHTKGISDIAFSPINANILASCSDDFTIRLWSITKQKCIKIFKKHTYHVTTLKFISKGNLLISGSADETITIWDLTTGKSLKTLAAHSDPVSSLVLTPDDTLIVSASYDGLMRLFDLESGQCLKTLVYNSASHGTATASTNDVVNFPISAVEISPNGKYILSSSLDGKLRLWDYMGNKVIKTYLGNKKSVSEKYNCDARFITATTEPTIVSGSDSSGLLFWDVQSKQIVFNLHSDAVVLGVALFNDGELLLSCDNKGAVTVYQLDPKYLKQGRISETTSLPDTPC